MGHRRKRSRERAADGRPIPRAGRVDTKLINEALLGASSVRLGMETTMNTTGLTLMLMFAITHEPSVPPPSYTDGCLQIDVTGEGFPVMYCAGDGMTYYIDLDGIDGLLGTEGDGRWVAVR